MKICSVIVTYNPNIDKVLNLVNQLVQQEVQVIIVDNNSKDFQLSNDLSKNCILINLKDNLGIALAQNKGIQEAIRLDASHIIFFDQDSKIDAHFIENIASDYSNLKDSNIIAIGPRFIDENKGFFFPALEMHNNGLMYKVNVEHIDKPIQVSVLISSGMLVSVSGLKDVGLMREEFFIDFVDTEWCLRAISKGYKIFLSKKAIMEHSVGDDTVELLGFKVPVHSGFRRYYRVRNLFLMWKIPYISKLLIIKLMLTNFAIQILLFLLKDKKMEYITYYLKAIRDGIKQSRNYHV